MASMHLTKVTSKPMQAAQLLARSFNTLDINHIRSLVTSNAELKGDRDNNQAEGCENVLNYLEKIINSIGAFHRPTIAEVARYEISPKKYINGVAIEIDDTPFLFIAIQVNKDGFIKNIYLHQESNVIFDIDLSGNRPGFDAARYEASKECIWAIRKEQVKNLSRNSRPHFVAVIHENQDPARILLALDELTRNYDGSTCELFLMDKYPIANIGGNGTKIEYKTSAEIMIDEIGTTGFPALGVMLNDQCIRPGYRSWHPDEVMSDLIKMGLPMKYQLNEAAISTI